MYQRSSRRPLTILVSVSLALNALLSVGYLQLRGQLDDAKQRIERVDEVKLEAKDLTRWVDRMRGCLDEVANGEGEAGSIPKACRER